MKGNSLARTRSKRLARKRALKCRQRKNLKLRRAALRMLSEGITVHAPRKILLELRDEHFKLTNFLDELRRKCRGGETRVLIDFSKTSQIIAGGGLLLYSELQRLKDIFPRVRFMCRESCTNRINQVLQHLNIFRILGHQSRAVPRRPDVVSWRHARADDVDCTGAGKIIEAYESLSRPVAKLLFKGASEAITNAVMHAYDWGRDDGLPDPKRKNWWMFCREDDNVFYMSVCDLGVGIPNTLTAKNAEEILSVILQKISFGAAPSDSQMIFGAMEYARTRTRKPQQGKGLMDLRKIIDQEGRGKLHVFSNRGCVIYDPVNGYSLFNYKNSIFGTLIVWSFPLVSGGAK